MRSAVQSCVPLQESTAETLCFFRIYPFKPCPAGVIHYSDSHPESKLSVAVVVMDVSERSERWLEGSHTKITQRFPQKAFLGTMRTDMKD